MKLATTAKLPKKTSTEVNDPDNPAWTEDMLGAPVIKRGRGPQATPTKVLTSVRLDADILEFFLNRKALATSHESTPHFLWGWSEIYRVVQRWLSASALQLDFDASAHYR